MGLTPLQLECQKLWADKSLSFGCMILMQDDDYDLCIWRITWLHNWLDYVFTTDIWVIWEAIENYWHPIRYDRLCYLYLNSVKIWKISSLSVWRFISVQENLESNIELYNQSILERPEELQLLVRDFLLSIQ